METLEKPLSTKVKVLKEEDCILSLSIELPKEETAQELETVFQHIQTRASLPGFRTGKAPAELVRKNFADKARKPDGAGKPGQPRLRSGHQGTEIGSHRYPPR